MFGNLLTTHRFDSAATCSALRPEDPRALFQDLSEVELGEVAKHDGVMKLSARYASACPECFSPLEGPGAPYFFRRLLRTMDESAASMLLEASLRSEAAPLSLSAARVLASRSCEFSLRRVRAHAETARDFLLLDAIRGTTSSSPSRKRAATER